MRKNKKIYILVIILILNFVFLLHGTNINSNKCNDKNKNVDLSSPITNESVKYKWNCTWGGLSSDEGHAVAVDSLGYIYVVGYTGSFGAGGYDMVVVKYDGNGVQQWNQTCGKSNTDECYGVTIDSLDNIYLAGYIEISGPGTSDMVVVKYDRNGVQQWNRTWGGVNDDDGYGVTVDSLGNVYLAGCTLSFGAGETDMALVKYNGNGVQQWNRTWGGTEFDCCFGIAVDSLGNVYLAGHTSSFSAGPADIDMVLVKFDENGVQQWYCTWNGGSDDIGQAVAVDSSNNVYLAGYTSVWETVGFAWDLVVVKYDENGIQQWNQTWGGAVSDYGSGITVDPSGAVYCAGTTRSFGAGERDLVLVKLNGNGVLQWNYTWGGSQYDYGYGVALDELGNIYLTGTTTNFGVGWNDMVLVKYGPDIYEEPTISGYNNILLFTLPWFFALISVYYIQKKIKYNK